MPTPAVDDSLLPKDYVVTTDGLYFAVVLAGSRTQPVHCSLRYVQQKNVPPAKLNTTAALDFLKSRYPRFLAYSDRLGAEAVMVPPADIDAVFKPRETITRLDQSHSSDGLMQKAVTVINTFVDNGVRREVLGITGSLMLGFHGSGSDIDMVIYDLDDFETARQTIREAMGRDMFTELDSGMWLDAYERRNCSLEFDEYIRHEKRKYNKFLVDNTKVDVSYIPFEQRDDHRPPIRKVGQAEIEGTVLDDSRVFAYPATYIVESDRVSEIQCYTATYTGQAFKGETIQAAGVIERDADGTEYMVIGTSREASGEYLRVI